MTAVTVAAAAGLTAMAARFSDALPDADAIAAEADGLRARAAALADEDATAYAAVLEAYRADRDEPGRDGRITAALEAATDVPMAIAACARDVGALAARLAADGNPNLRGDAITAAVLADAAARTASHLVALNVRAGGLGDDRLQTARALTDETAAAAQRAEAAT